MGHIDSTVRSGYASQSQTRRRGRGRSDRCEPSKCVYVGGGLRDESVEVLLSEGYRGKRIQPKLRPSSQNHYSYKVNVQHTHRRRRDVHSGDGQVTRLRVFLTRGVRHNRLASDSKDDDGHDCEQPAGDEDAHLRFELVHDSLSFRDVGSQELAVAFKTEGELRRHKCLKTCRGLPEVVASATIEVRVTVEEGRCTASRGRTGCGVQDYSRGRCGVDDIRWCGVDSIRRSTRIVSSPLPRRVCRTHLKAPEIV